MKKIASLAAVVLGALTMMTGCTAVNTSDAGNMTINPATVGPICDYRPVYEIASQERVGGEATVHALFGLFVWGGDGVADYADMTSEDDGIFAKFLPNARAKGAKAAFYDACAKNQCDALVSARYVIKETNYIVYARYNISIKGYPVVQKGIEEVRTVPYYIDSKGDIRPLKEFIKFHNVLPESGPLSGSDGILGFLPF